MTFLLLGIFLQIIAPNQTKPDDVSLCADPTVFHSSVLLSICNINSNTEFAYGICWSDKADPTIFDAFTIFNSSESSLEFRVTKLEPEKQYYLRFFKMTQDGVARYYNPFQIETIRELQLGDYYQGGIICYFYKPKDSLYVPWEQHGLIMSIDDLGYAQWGMHGRPIADSTNQGMGFGALNTEKILRQLGSVSSTVYSPTTTGMRIIHPCAALLCDQYVSDGYDDWFLPSKGEWYELYLEFDFLTILGLNSMEHYWSSSEVYFTWRFRKDKPRHTTYHHRRAWQVQLRARELVIYTMTPKKNVGLVRAMRYF
jgi:hypothetical protein